MGPKPGVANMKIKNQNNVLVDATVLLYFELPKYNKEYAVYTYGEKSESGFDVNYVSVINRTETGIVLNPVETDEEWNQIKEIMKTVIKSNRE